MDSLSDAELAACEALYQLSEVWGPELPLNRKLKA
jgi:hypothetical protein